ncbi:MAG TPA: hypothetical protein DCE08_05610 [Ruminococcaceae bacterium]|nr:hypothetical protein [Oscillospiraceae bacterium]
MSSGFPKSYFPDKFWFSNRHFCAFHKVFSSVISSLSQQNSRTAPKIPFTDVKTGSTEKFEEKIAKYCKKGIDIPGVLC